MTHPHPTPSEPFPAPYPGGPRCAWCQADPTVTDVWCSPECEIRDRATRSWGLTDGHWGWERAAVATFAAVAAIGRYR